MASKTSIKSAKAAWHGELGDSNAASKIRFSGALEVGVAVRRVGCVEREPLGIQPAKLLLELVARCFSARNPCSGPDRCRPCRSITRALPAA